MKYKKILAFFLSALILLSLCSCQRKDNFKKLKNAFEDATKTGVVTLNAETTLTKTEAHPQNSNPDADVTNLSATFDIDTNQDISRFSSQISANGAPYEDLFDYVRNQNMVYYNAYQYGKLTLSDADFENYRRIIDKYTEVDITNVGTLAKNQVPVSPVVIKLFNAAADDILNCLYEEKAVTVKNGVYSFSITPSSVSAVLDCLANIYNDKENNLKGIIVDSLKEFGCKNQVSKGFESDDYGYRRAIDHTIHTWNKCSSNEKLEKIKQFTKTSDFTVILNIDTNQAQSFTINITGDVYNDSYKTTINGVAKIAPRETFTNELPKYYLSHEDTVAYLFAFIHKVEAGDLIVEVEEEIPTIT